MESARCNYYGILCHRQYADRIREALLHSDAESWLRLAVTTTSETRHSIKQSTARENHIDSTRKCVVIPTPDEKGSRKDRIGFSLLIIHGAVMSPADLPPMARKQLSWAGHLTHHSVLDKENGLHLNSIVREIWYELTKKSSYDSQRDFLRIDVQPKTYNSEVCAAFTDMMHPVLINLACSASKVSHVVNIVLHSTSSSNAQSPTLISNIFWGISTAKQHFEDLNQRLNEYATGEIKVVTENDLGLHGGEEEDIFPSDVPVSRAYYKLAQVFQDEKLLKAIASPQNSDGKNSMKTMLSHGTGLDIGASPGGWTQVLHNTLHMPTVIALDPAILAKRVMKLQGVNHLRADVSSEESIKVLSHNAPYSVIVCDASMSNANELLVKIAETLDRVSSLLKEESDEKRNGKCPSRDVVAWPLCLVVTLKLPYKTVGSIDRNMEKVTKYIPEYLRRIALLGPSYPGECSDIIVEVQYKICHLFANSLSERTLISIFNNK
ncbi:hypothetical protein ACHAW5_005387 [Stephanodiscus triporus]|uniref:Ribosomal RNA methyltransferase FtsJ domain-containing protein n=1 Tax=Stephanodiscus triporus TaxID=2934178 RepID=A0ABD3P9K5_9STRA